MARDGFFTGLDIGTSSIKVLVAELVKKPFLVITLRPLYLPSFTLLFLIATPRHNYSQNIITQKIHSCSNFLTFKQAFS